jgi:hypothetical protein
LLEDINKTGRMYIRVGDPMGRLGPCTTGHPVMYHDGRAN